MSLALRALYVALRAQGFPPLAAVTLARQHLILMRLR
jgi:hypothetical protein